MGMMIFRPDEGLVIPGVRVWQQGDTFLPTMATGLQFWFDAQDSASVYTDSGLTTLAVANGTDVVGGWKDRSGNNFHATQATTGNKPIFFNNIIGTKKAVKSDGTNDFLATASVAPNITTGDFYIAAVIVRHGSGTGYRAIFGGVGGNFGVFTRVSSADKLSIYAAGDKIFNSTIATSTAYLLEFWRTGSVLRAAINAVQEATTIANGFNVLTGAFYLFSDNGTADFGDIYLAELLCYNNLPTARSSIQAYLNGRYAIY